MLNTIRVDEVRRVAELAGRAAADRRDFLTGLRRVDLGGQEKERGSRHPTDLDTLDILPAGASAALDDLRRLLDGLTAEQRIELRAVVLIGRGDFAGNQWDAARTEAARPPDATDVADIVEKLRLHDDLMKGLYEMNVLDGGRQ